MSAGSPPPLETLRVRGEISGLDHAFARSLGRLSGESRPEVLLAAALASRQTARGDVCLDLPALCAAAASMPGAREPGDVGAWPPLSRWLAALADSPLVAGPGDACDDRPLVLDARGRLYLQRFFRHQTRVAAALRARCDSDEEAAPAEGLASSIERLVPAGPDGASAGPRRAVAVAATHRLCVISGGPGTGKTTTAALLLAVLVDCALRAGQPPPRIALAAPTGKAAARLAEAIARVLPGLPVSDAVREAIPRSASTLHRLLRIDGRPARAGRAPVRLRFELVLVDEASMIDLALMDRLLEAMPDEARLLLLGDADQLASVEAGSVFSDMCGDGASAAERAPAIRSCVVTLRTRHRYAAESGIGALADAVRDGDPDRALAVLADDGLPDVALAPPVGRSRLGEAMERAVLAGYAPFARAADAGARLAALDGFRVLCALREGPFGVLRMNRAIDGLLVDAGLLPVRLHGPGAEAAGRPLLVTRNAPESGLWNGDVGVLLHAPTGGTGLRAFFHGGDHGSEGALRELGLGRLPPHEPVFAMSVHKSQGSELDEVALVLPDAPVPLLTRELVYTAVTRARRRVVVHADEAVLRAAIASRIARASGLRNALWGTA